MLLYPHSFSGFGLLFTCAGSALPRAMLPATLSCIWTIIIEFGLAEWSATQNDIFGNPFQQTTLHPSVNAWSNGTVRKLAQVIYDGKQWDRLPLLADAMEDAGCEDEAVLTHLRTSGSHNRGDWVVDQILGRG